MSLTPINVYGAAFSYWRHLQEQLAQTILDYADACSALKTALEILPVDYSTRDQQAEAVFDLHSLLSALTSYEQTLQKARFSLMATRKATNGLIPINSLPIEILATIFVSVVQQGADAICNLNLVCKLWRRIALQTPACWSWIALPVGLKSHGAYDYTEVWAKRAQNQPLRLSIWEYQKLPVKFDNEVDASGMLHSLVPLMSRVYKLELEAKGVGAGELVPEILGCWVQHGSTGTAETLELDIPVKLAAVRLSADSGHLGHKWPSPDAYESFFGSLHSLSVVNAKLDRRLGFYSGLVNLHLGPIDNLTAYTQWDIAAILKECSKLSSLAIVDHHIKLDRENPFLPNAIALNDLKVLRLESRGPPKNIWIFLQIITSSSDSIRMSVTFEEHPKFIPAARSFLERFKVTVLYIDSPSPESRYPCVSPVFVRMQHLEHLVIRNCLTFDGNWQSSAAHADFWPRLDELSLMNDTLDRQDLQQLLSIRVPRTVWLWETKWDDILKKEVVEEISRHGANVIVVEREQDMLVRLREFAAKPLGYY
ncbi:hypothetical protein FRC12_014400 [Ceratobasidium sp. 428]|nr:hypothetical protein FRC12_014400 [Ceratobasidium sp. 428]